MMKFLYNRKSLLSIEKTNNVFISLLIYKILFELVYILVISQYFTYAGWKLEADALKIVMSWISFPVLLHLVRRDIVQQSFSSIVLFLLEIGYVIPMTTVYAYGGMTHNCFCFFVAYWIFLELYLRRIKKINFSVSKVKYGKKCFIIFVFVLLLFAIYIAYKYNGLSINVTLNDVYERRAEMELKNIPVVLSYIMSMLGMIIPITVAMALERKKYAFAVVLSVAQMLLYSIGAIKKYLFFLILAWGCCLFVKNIKMKKMFLPVLNIINVAAIFNYLFTNGMPQIANYIQRRTFLLPIKLYTYYFDYFTTHEPDYLRQSVLRYLGIKSKYTIPIQNLIGVLYAGSEDTTASNGLCGDAVANLGYLSVLIYPFLIVVLLRLFDVVTANMELCVKLTIALVFFTYLTNGSFFSNLLSNGFILLWFLLFLVNEKIVRKKVEGFEWN